MAKMRRNNINAQVINAMQILEIDDQKVIPLMKTVRRSFLRLAKAKHPDGGAGKEEDFIELLEAKEYLMHHIKTNKPQEENHDEDEELSRKEFHSANITKINIGRFWSYFRVALSSRQGFGTNSALHLVRGKFLELLSCCT